MNVHSVFCEVCSLTFTDFTGAPSSFVAFFSAASVCGILTLPLPSTSTLGSCSPSVVLGHKVVTNREQIFSEFLCSVRCAAFVM